MVTIGVVTMVGSTMDMCGMTLGIIPISMATILVGTMVRTTDTILTLEAQANRGGVEAVLRLSPMNVLRWELHVAILKPVHVREWRHPALVAVQGIALRCA